MNTIDPAEVEKDLLDLLGSGQVPMAVVKATSFVERSERESSKTSRVTLELRCLLAGTLERAGRTAEALEVLRKARRLHEVLDRPGSLALSRLDELEADLMSLRGATAEACSRYDSVLTDLANRQERTAEISAASRRVQLKKAAIDAESGAPDVREQAWHLLMHLRAGHADGERAARMLLERVAARARAAPVEQRVAVWREYLELAGPLGRAREFRDTASWNEAIDVLVADVEAAGDPGGARVLELLRSVDPARYIVRLYDRFDPGLRERRLSAGDGCRYFVEAADFLLEAAVDPPGSGSPLREQLLRMARGVISYLEQDDGESACAGPQQVFAITGVLEQVATEHSLAGRTNRARQILAGAFSLTGSQMGDDHSDTRRLAGILAEAIAAEGHHEQAASFLDGVAEDQVARYGPDSDRVSRLRHAADEMRSRRGR